MRQLHAFSQCRYKPSCTNSEYIAWKRRQKREVTQYLNLLTDCIPVVPDQLYITRFVRWTRPVSQVIDGPLISEFPGDADAAESLLLDLGATHLVSISSAQVPPPNLPSIIQHYFINVPNHAREALLLELPCVCKFIGDAIAGGGQVLVQCRAELRACIVVCAYRERHRTGFAWSFRSLLSSHGFTEYISPSGICDSRSRCVREAPLINRFLNILRSPSTLQSYSHILSSSRSIRCMQLLSCY